jgi:hypothetical protein
MSEELCFSSTRHADSDCSVVDRDKCGKRFREPCRFANNTFAQDLHELPMYDNGLIKILQGSSEIS